MNLRSKVSQNKGFFKNSKAFFFLFGSAIRHQEGDMSFIKADIAKQKLHFGGASFYHHKERPQRVQLCLDWKAKFSARSSVLFPSCVVKMSKKQFLPSKCLFYQRLTGLQSKASLRLQITNSKAKISHYLLIFIVSICNLRGSLANVWQNF